jgi:hypothetical protein
VAAACAPVAFRRVCDVVGVQRGKRKVCWASRDKLPKEISPGQLIMVVFAKILIYLDCDNYLMNACFMTHVHKKDADLCFFSVSKDYIREMFKVIFRSKGKEDSWRYIKPGAFCNNITRDSEVQVWTRRRAFWRMPAPALMG